MQLNLNDKDFLEYYCESCQVAFDNGDTEMYFIKDKDFNTYYTSKGYNNYFYPDDISSTEKAFEDDSEEQDKEALRQDELIGKTRASVNYLFVDVYKHIAIVRKRPIINPNTNNFVGILGQVRPFLFPNIMNFIYRMNKVTYGLINNQVEDTNRVYRLTQRQHVVLFLYINRYSYSDVAAIMTIMGLKISANRVNDHLENLKYIFGVKTKEQLIEKAISLNYHLLIPRQLTRPGFYPIEDQLLITQA